MRYIPFDPQTWHYEFDAWKGRLGGIPQALICSASRDGAYEMDSAHVFQIRPNRFALVLEQGCSCYYVEEADIYIYERMEEAIRDFFRWCDSRDRPRHGFKPSGVEEKGP